MAIVKQAVSRVEQSKNLHQQKFTIAPEASDHIISLLAYAYTRPVWSSIREMVQNALDANLKGKVRIETPTKSNPVLTVRDTGAGLDVEGFNTFIGRIGASDKRGDETKAGALGIGSVAPMSIADSMTMTSFQNGKKVSLHIYKQDDGTLAYSVSDVTSCPGEEDGMLVSVPVPEDMWPQIHKALEVFRFSKVVAERLVVNGCDVVPFTISVEKKTRVGEHEVVFKLIDGVTEVLPGALVLLNGLPMSASFERFPELQIFSEFLESHEAAGNKRYYYGKNTTMVIDVPAAAGLAFPPSREVVAVTKLNAAFLNNACRKYFAEGIRELEEKGLQLGSESAVLAYWRSSATQQNKKMADCKELVMRELNKMSKHLKVQLSFSYYGGKATPLAVIEPKVPEECCASVVSVELVHRRRSSGHYYRMSTCGLAPIDPYKPELGVKFPFPVNSEMTLVVWSMEPEENGTVNWSGKLARDIRFKQAMLELTTEYKKDPYNNFRILRINALVLAAPLPDDHPLKNAPNVKAVDFEEYCKDFEPSDWNPYKLNEQDEEENARWSGGPKQRHTRKFVTSDGSKNRYGLPAGVPFAYLEVCRDKYTSDNSFGLPAAAGGGWCKSPSDFIHWLQFFERSGISEGIETVELRPAEAKNIKREHVLLKDMLAAATEDFYETMTVEEKHWLPFCFYRVLFEVKTPALFEYFNKMSENVRKSSSRLNKFLTIVDAPPTDRMYAVYKHLKQNAEQNTNLWVQFESVLDADLTGRVRRGRLSRTNVEEVFGFKIKYLQVPLEWFTRWFKEDTQLVKLTKLFWTVVSEKQKRLAISANNEMTYNIIEAGNEDAFDSSRFAEMTDDIIS